MSTATSSDRITVHLTYDPADMARRGRIGAYVAHSRHDTRELTQAARAAFRSKFEAEVDPDGLLPPAERQRRAEAARKAHFARLARLSAIARAQRTSSAPPSHNATPQTPRQRSIPPPGNTDIGRVGPSADMTSGGGPSEASSRDENRGGMP